jgi:nucleoside-diphosphate-sugar epimerase
MNRVMVTGGSGFIGRHLLPLLTASGAEVHAVYHASRPITADRRVHWHQTDIFDGLQVKALVRQILPEQLVHLAWYTTPPHYLEAGENLSWTKASIGLFREFAEGGGKRAVAIGTCAEYDWSGGHCVEDSTPLEPTSLYGRSKKALHTSLAELAASDGFSAAWARLFFPYGPGEHPSKLVTQIATALLKGERACCLTPWQKRDFTYVTDVASAIVAILRSGISGAINVGSGVAVTAEEIATRVAHQIGHPELLEMRARDPSSNVAPLVVADVGKLRDLIHWTPGCSLEEGIGKTIEYCRRQLHS